MTVNDEGNNHTNTFKCESFGCDAPIGTAGGPRSAAGHASQWHCPAGLGAVNRSRRST
jgi:hypothetical protein